MKTSNATIHICIECLSVRPRTAKMAYDCQTQLSSFINSRMSAWHKQPLWTQHAHFQERKERNRNRINQTEYEPNRTVGTAAHGSSSANRTVLEPNRLRTGTVGEPGPFGNQNRGGQVGSKIRIGSRKNPLILFKIMQYYLISPSIT